MKIALLSDTHGDLRALQKILKIAPKCEAWLHAGDVLAERDGASHTNHALFDVLRYLPKINVAFGNNDRKQTINTLNQKETSPYGFVVAYANTPMIWLTHGAGQTQQSIVAATLNHECQYAICGHTHRRQCTRHHSGIWLINPGSASLPRDSYASFAVLDTGEASMTFFSLDDGDIAEFIMLD